MDLPELQVHETILKFINSARSEGKIVTVILMHPNVPMNFAPQIPSYEEMGGVRIQTDRRLKQSIMIALPEPMPVGFPLPPWAIEQGPGIQTF